MKALLKISIYIFLVCLTACTKEEYPSILIDGTTITSPVEGEGDTIYVTFNVNTAWRIKGPTDVDIVPASGLKGTNTIEIVFPCNWSSQSYKTYYFQISTDDNLLFLADFNIEQKPAPFLRCTNELLLKQEGGSNTMTIYANEEPQVTSDVTWIEFEMTKADETDAYCLMAVATENLSLEEREATVTLTVGNLKKEITIKQEGGIIFKSELFNASSKIEYDGTINKYMIPPTEGQYTLKIIANCPWTLENDDNVWSDNFNVNLISKENNSATYTINVSSLEKDANRCDANIIFKFNDGSKKSILISQNNWRLRLFVGYKHRLSEKIYEVQQKLIEGYYIDDIDIYGGIIDVKAPETVRSISISDVETVPSYFCVSCTNLTRLRLSNVKQIGTAAFYNHNISWIEIPASVTYIGDHAFGKNKNWYAQVQCYSSIPPNLGDNVFHDGTGAGWLKVPLGSKAKYKGNSSWSKQFSSFEEF